MTRARKRRRSTTKRTKKTTTISCMLANRLVLASVSKIATVSCPTKRTTRMTREKRAAGVREKHELVKVVVVTTTTTMRMTTMNIGEVTKS